MKANTKNKKNKSPMRKLLPAAGSLMISAAMLSTSTYAWFTMNKTVKVTGMEMKAHAEEGLLINEVAASDDTNWDEQAQGAASPTVFELRPASTADLAAWWHANSKKSADEAGVDAINDTVDVDANHNKYTNISMTGASASKEVIIGAANAEGNGQKATGGTQAETNVYYSNAHFGSQPAAYDNGEGFYVNYKYYIKSSSSTALSVSNLGVAVTATLSDDNATANDLDKALRVGVKIDNEIRIFAPVTGGQISYDVTGDAAGTADEKISVTAYNSETNISPTNGTTSIPAVTSDGKLIDVFVWFEGEDEACMSDNLTVTLNAYKIDITFTDNDL